MQEYFEKSWEVLKKLQKSYENNRGCFKGMMFTRANKNPRSFLLGFRLFQLICDVF